MLYHCTYVHVYSCPGIVGLSGPTWRLFTAVGLAVYDTPALPVTAGYRWRRRCFIAPGEAGVGGNKVADESH